ncbi:CPBP family intramembrane metalloprotease [Candidatus Peregrinibacteria bacterium]|jgi:uncharacterized protein|nr:CPBP family intramembrane metalloprotease [Candidatus Peregrinibacteria bacterium]
MSKYFQAPWTIKDVVIILLIVVGVVLGIDLIFYFTNGDELLRENFSKEWVVITIFLAQSLILLVPLVALSFIKEKKWKWISLGFTKKGIWKGLLQAVVGYFAYIVISIFIMVLILYGGLKIPGYQLAEPVLPMFGDGSLALILAGVITMFVAPFIEEIFFRGFVLQGISNSVGKIIGAFSTALLFAVFHLQFGSFVPILILGLILSVLFIQSKSIWPCIWFHIINNSIAFTVELMILQGIIPLDF